MKLSDKLNKAIVDAAGVTPKKKRGRPPKARIEVKPVEEETTVDVSPEATPILDEEERELAGLNDIRLDVDETSEEVQVDKPEMSIWDIRAEANAQKTQKVRAVVNIVYEIQKVRIATGNRITQSFMQQFGVKPSQSAKEMDKEIRSLIEQLTSEHDRVADVYVNIYGNKGKIEKAIQYLGEELAYIKHETDYQMISIYNHLMDEEKAANNIVKNVVVKHPMWDAFFKDIPGCGHLMSAVCISRFDPFKARHASSFHRYAGLDVVWEDALTHKLIDMPEEIKALMEQEAIDANQDPTGAAEVGSLVYYDVPKDGTFTVELGQHVHIDWDDGREPFDEDCLKATVTDKEIIVELPGAKFTFPMQEKDIVIKPNKFNGLKEPLVTKGAKIIDFNVVDREVPRSVSTGRMVGRSKRHLIDVQYKDKDGVMKTKKSISYNPFVKTKLMGVLADSFLRCPGSKYEQVYRNYRARIDVMPRHYGKTAAHRHMMAKRYAVKQFLTDMWRAWRLLEGLPVSDPYPVAKLGMKPHGYNYGDIPVAANACEAAAMDM